MAIKPPQPSMFTGAGPEDPPPPPPWGYPSGTPSGMNCWREVEMLLKYKCQRRKPVSSPAPPTPTAPKKNTIVKIEGFCMVDCICRESMDLPELLPAPGSFGRLYVEVQPECGAGGWRWVKVRQRTNMGPCTDYDDDGTWNNCIGGSGIYIDEEVELPFKEGDWAGGPHDGGGATGWIADSCHYHVREGFFSNAFWSRDKKYPYISRPMADCMNKLFCDCETDDLDFNPGIVGAGNGMNDMREEQLEKMIDNLLRQAITDEDCRPGGTGSA